MNEKYLTFRGDIRGLVNCGERIAFVTEHEEGLPIALYLLDPSQAELEQIVLETGCKAIFGADEDLWIAGSNQQIYHCDARSKTVRSVGRPLSKAATQGSVLSQDRLALACDTELMLLDAKTGKERQTLPLDAKISALASDPDGDWLTVGTESGLISVYETNDEGNLQLSEQASLHNAAVTAILYEEEELRFLSAGADRKLLLTHARGKLEPEDRGKSFGHTDKVTRILHAPGGERIITVSRDKSCKTWVLQGGSRPATLSDGVPSCVDATIIQIHERSHLVVAGEDNSLRLFLLDAGGKFSAATHRFYDAYARASNLGLSDSVAVRGEAVTDLSDYDDARSLEELAKIVQKDRDAGLRLRATELIGKSKHALAETLLGPLFQTADARVRLAAFESLQRRRSASDLRTIESAIESKQKNIGLKAVEALQPLAQKDDVARQLLINVLDAGHADVRIAAMLALESVFGKKSPDATLTSVKAQSPDIRRLGLMQFYKRGFLKNSRVQTVIRRLGEDADPDVRLMSFLVMLLGNDKLATAVRQHDKELHRLLYEVESFELVVNETDASDSAKSDANAKEPPKAKKTKAKLADEDLEPLLTAISSSATDTCLRGACSLAYFKDSRAFGALLQLSREKDAEFRVQVARALASLEDERATERLTAMLDDEAAEVRDAAYSSLVKLEEDPFDAADAGLMSLFEDVRRRALQTLVATLRKSKAKSTQRTAQAMLLQFLNDAEERVRNEAFKACLNNEIAGDLVSTLRFVLESAHPSVRREVLTEAMAQDREEWAKDLLEDLLNDPNETIRHDAFEHIVSLGKGRDVAGVQSGLASKYPDVRLVATRKLAAMNSTQAHEALVGAIHDEEREIRLAALHSLISARALDVLQQAMDSQYIDVRISAACARAKFRDPDCKETLLDVISGEEPENEDDRQTWQALIVSAMEGLGHLKDSAAVEALLPFLNHKCTALRSPAARAIAQCLNEPAMEQVEEYLQHDDANVRFPIAWGLALQGHELAKPIVFASDAKLSPAEVFTAAHAYGDATETRLADFLDSKTPWLSTAALLVLLSRDRLDHDGTPRRILLALSARNAQVRLWAAKALESFNTAQDYHGVICALVNAHPERDADWTIASEVVEEIERALVHGDPRLVAVLEHLGCKKAEEWEFQWQTSKQIWEPEFAAAEETASNSNAPTVVDVEAAELERLALGTYIGLVREQGQPGKHRPFDISIVRQTAIRRLAQLAAEDTERIVAIQPVLIQALSNRLADVRALAFEKLKAIGLGHEQLAEAAIECGHSDIAIEGLKLLSGNSDKKAREILEAVLKDGDPNLALEVAELLTERIGIVEASEAILECNAPRPRLWCLQTLAAAWDKEPKVHQRLRDACESRFKHVRLEAAQILAAKKDPFAFEALSKLLREASEAGDQRKVVGALINLRHPGSAALLLDRLEDDPAKTADNTVLLNGIGDLRDPEIVDRLLNGIRSGTLAKQAINSVVKISGYDQPIQHFIEDLQDETVDQEWLKKQFPRHDQVLAQLLAVLNDGGVLTQHLPLLTCAQWSFTSAVDDGMAQLATHPEANIRERVVQAIGWRLQHRSGPADGLQSLLNHKEANTRFFAAEGLALGGKSDGVGVLLSAVELLQDLLLRQRAIKALGSVSDPRAWDLLLRIVTDETHALRYVAAEAIGHLGTTERADDILELLKPLAKGQSHIASAALIGLRWLDVPQGWDLIRSVAQDSASIEASCALEQLAHNDQPETRDLLLKYLQTHSDCDYPDQVDRALKSARKLFGMDSLEPDFAFLRCSQNMVWEPPTDVLKRVCQAGEAGELLSLLRSQNPTLRERILTSLLARNPLPAPEAEEAIASQDAGVVEAAAHILGRSQSKSAKPKLQDSLQHWHVEWNYYSKQLEQGRIHDAEKLEYITAALQKLTWALGKLEAGSKELVAVATDNVGDARFAPVRLSALRALLGQKVPKAGLNSLERLKEDSHFEVRSLIHELFTQQAEGNLEDALSNRNLFQRLAKLAESDSAEAAKQGVASVHRQGVVLSALIENQDVAALADTALSPDLEESTRLGALEALAQIASDESEAELVSFATQDDNSEELRKAAWRGLRRSKRLRQKRALV